MIVLFFWANSLFAYATILNYPNPFVPPFESTKIYYLLEKNADTKIYIFNIANRLVQKISTSAGEEGGKIGANQVVWNGMSNFGEILPNGVYFCNVVSDGALIGRGKIAILK